MQGGRGPGHGVYLARRIVGVLVILVLLVLLVPRACQALWGPEEEPSPLVPETSATDEESAGDAEVVPAPREVADDISTAEITRSVDIGGDADGEYQQDLEGSTTFADLPVAFEAPLDQGASLGDVTEATRAPEVGVNQQAVQSLPFAEPILPAEPGVFAEPILPVEPGVFAEPILPAEPGVFAAPILPAEPDVFAAPILPTEVIPSEEPILFEEGALFEEPIFWEEPTLFEEGGAVQGSPSEAIAAAPVSDAGDIVDTGGALAVAGSVVAASG
jgi:hypothetical protein